MASTHLYKRGRVWWGWYTDAYGVLVRKTTKCTDKTAAAEVVAGWERDARNPVAAAARGATLGEALDYVILEKTAQAQAAERARAKGPTKLKGTAETVSCYTQAGDAVLLFAGRKLERVPAGKPDAELDREERKRLREVGKGYRLADVTKAFVDEMISWRRVNGISESRISKNRLVLRMALQRAKARDLYAGDLEVVLPSGFATGYTPKAIRLTLPQVWQLLDAVTDPARKAVFAFSIATGAEWRAIERAERADVVKGAELVHVRGTKTNLRDRFVPIVCEWQRKLLDIVLEGADGQGEMLFGASMKRPHEVLRRACLKASLPHLSPHGLRHVFAHAILGEGVSEGEAASALGHSGPVMVNTIYGRSTGEELLARMKARVAERSRALVAIQGGKSRARKTA